jgi:hypothetical protein
MYLRQIIQATKCLLTNNVPIDLIEIIINYATHPKYIICPTCPPDCNRCAVCYKCLQCNVEDDGYFYMCKECTTNGWSSCAAYHAGYVRNVKKGIRCVLCRDRVTGNLMAEVDSETSTSPNDRA